MDFELTGDQKMLAETASAFAAKTSPVSRFRRLRDKAGWEETTWKQMGELGWLGVAFPESVGGLGGSMVDAGLILEKLATTLTPEPYVASVVLGGMALVRAGTGQQHKRWLSPMIEGDTSLALAWAEPQTRYDAAHVRTKAVSDGRGGYTLSGRKVFALNGHRANVLLVSAATPQGLGLFAIDKGAGGVEITPITTIDGLGAAMIRLEGVACGRDALLGEPGEETTEALEYALDCAAVASCAEGVGLCQTILTMTTDYLRTREQFGVKIGVFQALQHRAVDMFVETELLRSMAMMGLMKVHSEDVVERKRAVSAAKVQLSVTGKLVSRQAIQLHGGIGITDEHDIGLYFKRVHALTSLFGDEEFHVARFATLPGVAPATV